MNYEFAKAVMRFFIDKKMAITLSQFDSTLAAIRHMYPDSADYVLQNLVDSHDTDRLESMIVNPDRAYNADANPRNNPNYRNLQNPDCGQREEGLCVRTKLRRARRDRRVQSLRLERSCGTDCRIWERKLP